MRLIKVKFVCALLLLFGSAIAQEPEAQIEQNSEVKQQFGYFSAGLGPFPLPLPVFAAGYRAQKGHHGMDLSLQASTIVEITQIKANILYHHYFKPSLASEFYIGGGVGPSYLFGSGKSRIVISPEFVFGKLYRNECNDLRFFQLQASFPTITLNSSRHQVAKFPLVVISYGIGF